MVAAVSSAHDHQVDNRQLVPALIAAVRRAGAQLHEHTEAAIDVVGGRAVGVRAGDRRIAADVVILAAGAWSRGVAGLPPAATPPVRPIKGQMLALRMDPAAPLLWHVVWAPKAYLVPRRDGRLLIGATVEERGFDPSITAGALYGLLDGAWRAVPAIEELPVDETWCGFRPGSRDLLTPITADAIRDCVVTGTLPAVARGFALDRFAQETPLEVPA